MLYQRGGTEPGGKKRGPFSYYREERESEGESARKLSINKRSAPSGEGKVGLRAALGEKKRKTKGRHSPRAGDNSRRKEPAIVWGVKEMPYLFYPKGQKRGLRKRKEEGESRTDWKLVQKKE